MSSIQNLLSQDILIWPQFSSLCIYKSQPMAQILPSLKFYHCVLIFFVTFNLYQINKTVPALWMAAQLLFTIFVILVDRKQNGRDWKQIFFSLSLIYALRPTELNILRFLFLAKIFYVYQSLKQVSQHIQYTGSIKFFKLLKVLINFASLLVVFYMTLGIFIVAYKYWAYLWEDPEKVLSTHQILYFFMITSSSIGFGDITPKNQYQMYFLIAFIPILVIIFGQMCGHAVTYLNQFVAILRENPHPSVKPNILTESIWGKEDCTNLIKYIAHTQSKNASMKQDEQLFAHNWLSLTCKSYQARQPLLIEILGSESEDSKEYRLLVASKIKNQFYPNNWKIIEKGNIDRNIYLIEQGQVEINGKILGPGSIFNTSGFVKEEPSKQTYLTNSITSLWAISQKELMDLGRNSMNLKTKISKKFQQQSENL